MATIKSYSQIVRGMLDRLRLVQPNLDTKPGSVARDLFVDIQADELEKVYSLISLISNKQSFATAVGTDLDKLARNFGFTRRSGAPASGTVIFSLDSLDLDREIPEGTVVSTRSGISFRTIGNYAMIASERNIYSANASRVRKQLDVAGAASGFAIEVPVEAINPGSSGNVGSYKIVTQSLPFNFSVLNISATSGGSDIESDSLFRTRFLTTFSGASIGTAAGYANAILQDEQVLDLLVVEPGNSLMLRDGTEILEGDFNSRRVVSSGTGGKVDIYVLGKSLREVSESFIFFNKSATGDVSDSINDHILGNFNQDITLTSMERRFDGISKNNIPFQPVDSIVTVSGETSGALTEGVNFSLIKDLNADTGGSPFGFDKIRFLSDQKNVFGEIINKTSINSSDALEFSDASNISLVYQNVGIEDENSEAISYDRSLIQLKHYPVSTVTRVLNFTTGELYNVESLRIDDSGINTDGIIKISGKQLPAITDNLKVDYVWRKPFDSSLDYLSSPSGSNVDWSSPFRKESLKGLSQGSTYYIDLDDTIFDVKNVYLFDSFESTVEESSGTLFVRVNVDIENIYDVLMHGVDIFNTPLGNHSIEGSILYLPGDSGAKLGEPVTVRFNTKSIYSFSGIKGSFQDNRIFLPDDSLFPQDVLLKINDTYIDGDSVIIDYYIYAEKIVPSTELLSLPVVSNQSRSRLLDSNLSEIQDSYKTSEYQSNKYVRYTPSRVKVSILSSVSSGEIKVSGTTLVRYDIETDVGPVFDGSKIDLSGHIEGDGIAKVMSAEIGNSSFTLNGYYLNSSLYSDDALSKSSLGKYEIEVPSTSFNNFDYTAGQKIKVSLFAYLSSDSEILHFYGNSERETQKIFLDISSISVNSGFLLNGSLTGSLEASFGNQPDAGDQYRADYSFKAPKEGERVFVSYNQNRIISDATSNVESARPITADIIIKEASELGIDVTATIVIGDDFSDESETIRDNAIDQVAGLLSTNVLGSIVDYSDVLRAITNVTGVESADVSLFNYTGQSGRRDFVRALDNQSIIPSIIDVSVVSRKDFRIS